MSVRRVTFIRVPAIAKFTLNSTKKYRSGFKLYNFDIFVSVIGSISNDPILCFESLAGF